MKFRFHSIIFLIPFILLISFSSLLGNEDSEVKSDKPKPSNSAKAEEKQTKAELAQAWGELSEDEKKKVREALRTVWSDPKVLSARENVNRSIKEYQMAIKETMSNQDPESASLLEKVHSGGGGFLTFISSRGMGPSGGGHKRGQSPRHHEHLLPPHVLDQLTPEQKAQFKRANDRAKMRPEVNAAIEKMRALRKDDEEFRKRQFEAIHTFRKTYFETLIDIDPSLSEFISPKIPGSGFGSKGSKGKGMRKRPDGNGHAPSEMKNK